MISFFRIIHDVWVMGLKASKLTRSGNWELARNLMLKS